MKGSGFFGGTLHQGLEFRPSLLGAGLDAFPCVVTGDLQVAQVMADLVVLALQYVDSLVIVDHRVHLRTLGLSLEYALCIAFLIDQGTFCIGETLNPNAGAVI